jgi:MSHA biogenesis protein MshQ
MNLLRPALLLLALLLPAATAQAQITVRDTTTATATTTGIRFRAVGTVALEASGNTIPAPGIPAGTVAGDILICIIESGDNVAHTMPVGWTQLSTGISGAAHRASIFWKRAVAGEPAPTVGHAAGNVVIARIIGFSGVDLVTAFDVANSFTVSAADFTVEAGAVTTVTENSMLVMAESIADNWTNLGLPTGNAAVTWNRAFYSATGSGNDAAIGAHYGRAAATGVQAALTSARTAGAAAAVSHGAQIALRPALFTINKPPLTQEYDVMIATIAVGPSTANVIAPAGWTLVQRTNQAAGNSSSLIIYRKTATNAEPASYSWNIAAGTGTAASSVTGVAATITSFAGVDLDTPQDAVGGNVTASSSTHTATAIATTVTNAMVVAFFEYSSSGSWSVPPTTTQLANVSTLAPPAAGGRSLGTFHNTQAGIGSTGNRASTASGGNADRGAAAILGLRPAVGPVLQLYMDEGAWIGAAPQVLDTSGSNLHGTAFGGVNTASNTPAVPGNPGSCRYGLLDGFNDYVEVPDNALLDMAGAFTVAVWIRPNASAQALSTIVSKDENYEFHRTPTGTINWWWQDSGAVARQFTTTGTAPDNTWTHVAIVYAAGLQQIYLNGVPDPTTLTDNNGLLTNADPLQVGSDQLLAARYFDGLIDEVRVYRQALGAARIQQVMNATRPCPTSDHFNIAGSTLGVTCNASTVTVTMHDASHNPVAYTGAVNISTSSSLGDWSVVSGGSGFSNGVANDGAASINFVSESTVVFNLRHTSAGAVGVNVSSGGFSEATGSAGVGDDLAITFSHAGFIFTDGALANLGNQVAGVTSVGYQLRAVESTGCAPGGPCIGACTAAPDFASGANVAVDLAYQCNNPTTCIGGQTLAFVNNGSTNIAGNPNTGVTAYTNKTLTWGANATANFTVNYSDVGQVRLHASYSPPPAGPGQFMTGQSAPFVVRPAGFTISSIQTTSGALANPGAADATGAVFARAGQAFTLTATAVNQAGNATPNYGRETAAEGVLVERALVGGLGLTNNPVLTNGTIAGSSFTNGVATPTNLSWDEVGIIRLTPRVADGDYLGAGDVIGTQTGNVGRFFPDHYTLTGTPTLANRSALGCGGTYSYMGEGMLLSFNLEARNAADVLTQNYRDSGTAAQDFAKFNPTTFAPLGVGARNASTQLTSRVSGLPPSPAVSWTNGAASVQVVAAIERNNSGANPQDNPDGPLTAVTFGIAPTDSDGVAMGTLDLDASVPAGNDSKNLNLSTEVRFGRLRCENAYGAVNSPLPIPLAAQYWNGTSFATNTLDSCTPVAPGNVAYGNYRNNLAAGEVGAPTITAIAGGLGRILLPTPAGGDGDYRGALDVTADLTAAAQPYLRGAWSTVDGDGSPTTAYDDNPVCGASFGLYGSQPNNFIFFRENF